MKSSVHERGFAAISVATIVMGILAGITATGTLLFVGEARIARNTEQSLLAFYAAEAGIEDALLRLEKGMSWSSPYAFSFGEGEVEVLISDIAAGARVITAEGIFADRVRKIEIVYELSTVTPGFFYGAQVGGGGLRMDNQSKVVGNVFSNGDAQLIGSAQVTDTILIAGIGKKLSGGVVGGNARADVCENAEVAGTLHANTVLACTSGSLTTEGLPVEPVSLPILDSEIETWKEDAAAGGTIGSYSRSTGTHILGPVKIEGDLIIQNTATLVVAGTLWVTGEITISNSARVRLDSSYGTMSGVIVGDALLTLQNSSVSSGSGAPGSYLMYVSASSANPAMIMKNSARADILYSNTGWVEIQNNTEMRSITGYGIHVKNNAELTYEIGLEDAVFTSGPAAGWTVVSWREVE
ncbi:MAG: pilus assembly PilX N-terminal domain-containing protein [Candidatus Yanofskybacteria bacterium]|nr:pilus assembly PilX N-terminal domain-containing protein [Candidatus Yanofskybacteria bacterium]